MNYCWIETQITFKNNNLFSKKSSNPNLMKGVVRTVIWNKLQIITKNDFIKWIFFLILIISQIPTYFSLVVQ